MTLLDRDDLPIFTYVSDMGGVCVDCGRIFKEGATVVRVGVAWASCGNNGWRHYHLDCYRSFTKTIERNQQ